MVSSLSTTAPPAVPDCDPETTHTLARLVERELAAAASRRTQFELTTEPVLFQNAVIAASILVNVLFCLTRSDYIILFVAASFYLNMFYFVSLLIPTSPGTAGLPILAIKKFQVWLKEHGITSGTRQFTRLFINAFFMNSRTLTFGIGVLFSVDIVFTLIAWYTGLPMDLALFVIVQSMIIITFYVLIWKVEPFTTGFAAHIDLVKHHLSRDLPSWFISLLFFIGFLIIVFIFMTTIILLPGVTLNAFLTGSGLTELAYLFVLLAILALSQYVVIRSIHGKTSRVMAGRLMDYWESSLRELRDNLSCDSPVSPQGREDRIEVTERILESRIYQIKRNALFGAFTVWVIDLDFSVMMDNKTLVAIRGYLGEKKE